MVWLVLPVIAWELAADFPQLPSRLGASAG